MVKKVPKDKSNDPSPWTGRLRARAPKIEAPKVAAASETPKQPQPSKCSQHQRAKKKLEAEAERRSSQHDSQSDEEKAQKRSKDAIRKTQARANESPETSRIRKLTNASNMARARSEETEDQSARRRELNASRTSRARSEEKPDETRLRQMINAASTSRARSLETEEDTRKRKMLNAVRTSESRDKESPEQTAKRRQTEKNRHEARSSHGGSVGLARSNVTVSENYLGKMSLECPNCKALHFQDELPQSKEFNSCCRRGLVTLPMFEDFPQDLKLLFVGSTSEAKEFQKNIRQYNNSLAMGCMKAQLDVPKGGGPYTFRLHGQVYHLIGPLHPSQGQEHVFAQVFIIDTEDAAAELADRKVNKGCSKPLFEKLIKILKNQNPFVKSFKMMHEKEEEEEIAARTQNRDVGDVKMVFREGKNYDPRRYQLPTTNEVAVVYVGDEEGIPGKREITVYQRSNGTLQSLRDTDKETDPLCYPLIFVNGQYGWHFKRTRSTPGSSEQHKMSAREFYSFYLHVRKNFNPLFYAGKLFQQYCVDMWTKIEQDRLNFIRQRQEILRVESMKGLLDHVEAEDDGPCGTRVYLPGSFSGSPRDMVAQFQDALTVVSKYGKPDLFITMTCNPHWKEIEESLFPGQQAIDRPDIVTRVFKLKVDEVKKDIFVRKIFGEVAAWIYVVEFQKRGLPHIHMLIILKDKWKPKTSHEVDKIVCAELPDKKKDPELFDAVAKMMMHRPCGVYNPDAPCMHKGSSCEKRFPKEFRDSTSLEIDGFPLYRRRDEGRTVTFKTPKHGDIDLDNRSVVPYNIYMIQKYKCHCNVEICGNVGAVKYLYKYVYKGTTRAAVHIYTDKSGTQHQVKDEINSYLDTRYVCAPESLHHIFEFKMSDRSTPVLQLKVHLENTQGIVFVKGQEKEAAEKGALRSTTLTAWFDANQKCADELKNNGMLSDGTLDTRGIHYVEMPEHFQFSGGKWLPRKRVTNCIGRMHFVSPRDQERYALRLLLLNITDAKSFEDLLTVGQTRYNTFLEASKAAGFLTDDSFYEQSLAEAASFHSAYQFRGFFVALLKHGEVHNAETLWNKFLNEFCEDFEYQGHSRKTAETLAYNDIYDRLRMMGEDLKKWMDLPYDRVIPQEIIDYDKCREDGENMRKSLYKEQEDVVEAALNAYKQGGGLLFVDGPGGSGKTFVYMCLINIFQGMHVKVAPMAWVGIAASLLPRGRTVASFYKLNVKDGCKTSTLHHQSAEAKRIAEVDVVLWDEAPASPKSALETIDQLLRDITGNDRPFGGKVFILGGDFRQCLPVMDKKGEQEQIANSIKKSKLWPLFKVYKLSTNMRVTDGNDDWKSYLLEIGNGVLGEPITGEMEIPEDLRSNGDIAGEVFGTMLRDGADVSEISKVAILSPKNKEALEMNTKILDLLPGVKQIYESVDEIGEKQDGESDATNFPTEFLHRMTPSGLPPHKLELKVGAIVMLLRNLDVSNHLCNGTRLLIEQMGKNVLKCSFITGSRKGETVFLPRIKLTFDTGIPFCLERRQFPVRLAFAMTINKSQGQTFDKIGLLLDEPIFTHGQLYVALSRTRTKEGIRIDSVNNIMNNIVFKDVL